MSEILHLEKEFRRLKQLDNHIKTCKAMLCALPDDRGEEGFKLRNLVEDSLDIWCLTRQTIIKEIEFKVDRFLSGHRVEEVLDELRLSKSLSATP